MEPYLLVNFPISFKKRDKLKYLQLLPSELKCLIVELSSGSPNSLTALARTHTAFQREAEKALYETLHIYPALVDSIKCMETLVTNSEKAGLVRSLFIDCVGSANNEMHRRTTTYLSKILINMHSLSDFRIRSWPRGVAAQSIMGLVKILWSVCKKFESSQN
jgi:hypothetical protein